MEANEKQLLLGIRSDLIELVKSGLHETAYCLAEEKTAWPSGYGAGIEATVDMMRRIVKIGRGDKGVELAVDYLCGFYRHDRSWNACVKAGFEKRLDEAHGKPYLLGFRIDTLEHGCAKAKTLRGNYRLEDVPSLPVSGCRADPFCCCGMYELLESVDSAVEWRKP